MRFVRKWADIGHAQTSKSNIAVVLKILGKDGEAADMLNVSENHNWKRWVDKLIGDTSWEFSRFWIWGWGCRRFGLLGIKLAGTHGVFREFRATGRSNATGA